MSTPVIVGAAAVTQHSTDPVTGLDAAGLMTRACRAAAAASGAPDLAARAGLVAVPRGTWRYPDAGRLVADALGATGAGTLCAEIGVLQTTVLSAAVEAVAQGRCDVALVAGGEALDRRRAAKRLGLRAEETAQSPAATPDVVLHPASDFRGQHEDLWGIGEPFVQYALIDSARRHRLGIGIEENRQELARLWSDAGAVAAANPHAWERRHWSPDELLDDRRRGNRMLAFPYTAKLVTQMYVDQAAAILVCGSDVARRAGIPPERWVYPAVTVDCDLSVPLVERAEPGECPQWGLVADAVETTFGGSLATVDHVDLYSCFPVAVSLQRDAFGFDGRADLTVTGGMTFGGGPLNNAALQAVATCVERLRTSGRTALVTAVSGFLTKQGAVLLTTEPPPQPYHRMDLTATARPLVERREVVATHTGPATVDAATTVATREGTAETVLLLRTPCGRGTVARTPRTGDMVGRTVDVIDGRLMEDRS